MIKSFDSAVDEVILYGSHMTGLNLPDSDIDVCVKFPENVDPNLDDVNEGFMREKESGDGFIVDVEYRFTIQVPIIEVKIMQDGRI